MAHVVIGPAGVVVVTPLPLRDGLLLTATGLRDGQRWLGEWFATRRWEAAAVAEALAGSLPGGWVVTARPLVVPVGAGRGSPLVPSWDGVALCAPTSDALAHHLSSLPAPLSRTDAAYLAAVAEGTLRSAS